MQSLMLTSMNWSWTFFEGQLVFHHSDSGKHELLNSIIFYKLEHHFLDLISKKLKPYVCDSCSATDA